MVEHNIRDPRSIAEIIEELQQKYDALLSSKHEYNRYHLLSAEVAEIDNRIRDLNAAREAAVKATDADKIISIDDELTAMQRERETFADMMDNIDPKTVLTRDEKKSFSDDMKETLDAAGVAKVMDEIQQAINTIGDDTTLMLYLLGQLIAMQNRLEDKQKSPFSIPYPYPMEFRSVCSHAYTIANILSLMPPKSTD